VAALLWQQEGSHGQRAWAWRLGIFCGCFPGLGVSDPCPHRPGQPAAWQSTAGGAGTWHQQPPSPTCRSTGSTTLARRLAALAPGTAGPDGRVLPVFDEGFWELGWSVLEPVAAWAPAFVGPVASSTVSLAYLVLAGARSHAALDTILSRILAGVNPLPNPGAGASGRLWRPLGLDATPGNSGEGPDVRAVVARRPTAER